MDLSAYREWLQLGVSSSVAMPLDRRAFRDKLEAARTTALDDHNWSAPTPTEEGRWRIRIGRVLEDEDTYNRFDALFEGIFTPECSKAISDTLATVASGHGERLRLQLLLSIQKKAVTIQSGTQNRS